MTNPIVPVNGNDTDTNPISEEINTSWSLLILISLLITIIIVSYILQRRSIKFIHESVVSILLGIIVGIVINSSSSDSIRKVVQFDHRYFFNLLLPPIILNSGYDLKMRNFFKNFGSILIFAFIGTFISTLFIGVIIFGFVSTGIGNLHWSFMECIIFGAILSSTDPVTVLSIFHQMKVDPKLYAIIFGESVLNDSVAIVLFYTLDKFKGNTVSIGTILDGIGSFLGVFTGSLLIGVILALLCALLFKYTQLYRYAVLESSLVALIAYASYILSNATRLSGIVSLLFCGITLKHYAYDNMSIRSRRTTKYMFRVLSQLSENFVFIYLGVTLFLTKSLTFHFGLIFFTLVLVMIARYVSTIPLAQLINYISSKKHGRSTLSQPRQQIPRNHQIMLWWAGLRGAIAFALSFEFHVEDQKTASSIRATVLTVCVISIIVLGGTTPLAIERLGIKTGFSHTNRGRKSTRKMSRRGSSQPSTSTILNQNDNVLASPVSDQAPDVLTEERVNLGQYHGEENGNLPLNDDENDSFEEENADTSEEEGSLVPALSRSSHPLGVPNQSNNQQRPLSSRAERDPGTPTSGTAREDSIRSWSILAEEDVRHWFLSFDNRWLKPLFTHSNRDYLYAPSVSQSSSIGDGFGFGRRSHVSPSRHSLLGSTVVESTSRTGSRAHVAGARIPRLPSSSRTFGRRTVSSEHLANLNRNEPFQSARDQNETATHVLNSAFSVLKAFGNENNNKGADQSPELWTGFMSADSSHPNSNASSSVELHGLNKKPEV